MCHNASQHREYIQFPHLDTLIGHDNKHRRILKQAHTEQKGLCIWCDRPTFLWWELTTDEWIAIGKLKMATREHMTPKSEGGLNGIDNITCACHRCNSIRGVIPENHFKWVTDNPKRFKRFLTLKQQKRTTRNINRKKSRAAHDKLMAAHAYNREERNDKKAANREIGVNFAIIRHCKDMRDLHSGVHLYPMQALVKQSETVTHNRLFKFAKQMRFERHNWIRSHRAYNVVLLNYMLWRYPPCQEPVKVCQPKAETLSFAEKVKKFFAKVNLKMVSLKHAHRSYALQSRKLTTGGTFK